jgi:hypothetical protein
MSKINPLAERDHGHPDKNTGLSALIFMPLHQEINFGFF